MRRVLVAFAAAIVFLAPSATFAAPVTLYFSGTWSFFDPPADAPAFHAALGNYGVVEGSQLSFSVTIDTAIGDSDPSATSGLYQAAVMSTRLSVGSLFLSCGAGSCGSAIPNFIGTPASAQLSPNSLRMVGSLATLPSLGGGLFAPSFLDLQATSLAAFLGSDSLTAALSNAAGWPVPTLFIGFQGNGAAGGLNLGTTNLTLVSIPESSTIAAVATGMIVFVLYRRRDRRGTRASN